MSQSNGNVQPESPYKIGDIIKSKGKTPVIFTGYVNGWETWMPIKKA